MSADDEVLHGVAGRGVKTLLTRWATAFEGPCEHEDRRQMTRATALRSCCQSCLEDDASGWQATGPCDVCGALVTAGSGAWLTPRPEDTGGIVVMIRSCLSCSFEQLERDDPEEDSMVCNFCKFGLQGGHRLSRLHRGWFHQACLEAAAGQGALVASAGDPGVARSMRITAARVRILGRER